MSTATIQMPVEQWEAMKKASEESQAEIIRITTLLTVAQTGDPSGRVASLSLGLRGALEIIGFSIANLSPEIIKGWPFKQLKAVCDSVAALPDVSVMDAETVFEFRKFANECEQWALKRSITPERYIPPPPGSEGMSRG